MPSVTDSPISGIAICTVAVSGISCSQSKETRLRASFASRYPGTPMSYFVTGATGFIGRNLVERLLQREGTIYALVRAGSRGRLEELRTSWGADGARIVPITGDLSQPGLGVSEEDLVAMRGEIDHFFHLAAIYDLTADAEAQEIANVEGTRHAIELAGRDRGRLLPPGQLDRRRRPLQGRLDARTCSTRPNGSTTTPTSAPSTSPSGWSARSASGPGGSTGRGSSSATRAPARSTRSTGPTTSSRRCSGLRRVLPSWLPTVGIEGGEINIVPVDYVAAAIDHIAHKPQLDGRAFHLTDPNPQTAGEVINLFARAADAPQMTVRLGTDVTEPATGRAAHGAEAVPAGEAGRRSWRWTSSACPPTSSPTSTTRPASTRPGRRKR